MGQAFDSGDHVLGSYFGETKKQVFDKLMQEHPHANRVEIRSVQPDEVLPPSTEMPRYRCHKEVWALKIVDIRLTESGTAVITPADSGYAPFNVTAAYVLKHEPQVGGYYVVYKDGYASFSPAAVFDEGYTRI